MKNYDPTKVYDPAKGRNIQVIPYEVIDTKIIIKGKDLRQARKNAGYSKAKDFARAHNLWSGSKQYNLEKKKEFESSTQELKVLIDALYRKNGS